MNYHLLFSQMSVGACHTFATLEVIHDATKGLKLSKEKLFLDHLFSLQGVIPESIDEVLAGNLKQIADIRANPKEKCKGVSWEGGKQDLDFC